jgi:hypothetical protein
MAFPSRVWDVHSVPRGGDVKSGPEDRSSMRKQERNTVHFIQVRVSKISGAKITAAIVSFGTNDKIAKTAKTAKNNCRQNNFRGRRAA